MHTTQNWRYTFMFYLYVTVLYQGVFFQSVTFKVQFVFTIFRAQLYPKDESLRPFNPLYSQTFHLLMSLLLPRSWLSGSIGLVTNNSKNQLKDINCSMPAWLNICYHSLTYQLFLVDVLVTLDASQWISPYLYNKLFLLSMLEGSQKSQR